MAEKRRISRNLTIAVAAAIALIVAAALAAPYVLPSQFIASQIAGLIHQKTGRDLRIAGPIDITLLPLPALVAHDVHLGSPPGPFSTDFLSAETVDIRFNPSALLRGRIEIDHLAIAHPVISFEVDPSGERNWIFHPIKPVASTSPQPSSHAAPSFAAGDVTLTDGTASYRDDRGDTNLSLTGLAATGSLPSADGPLSMRGAATYNGEPVQVTVALASPAALNDGGPSHATMAIVSTRGNVDFDGTVGADDPATTTGRIDFKTASLRDLLAWLKIGGLAGDADFGALSLDGDLHLAGANATFADATIVLDGVTAKGALAFSHAAGRSELDVDGLALGGGKASGTLVVDRHGAAPDIAAHGKLTGVTVARLPVGIAGFDTLAGTGDVAFDLTGTGKTMRQLIASLNGSARLDLANGSVASAGLPALLRTQLGPALNEKAVPRDIAYRSLSASATIAQGVLRNDDLKLVGPQLNAAGSGTLDLAAHRIDYLWQPDIAGLGSAKLEITGDWANPDYKVDSVNITGGKALSIPGLKLR